MGAVSKWIVAIAILIVGFVLGVVLHEAFDLFDFVGLGSRRAALRRERDGYYRQLEERDRIHGEIVDSYKERIKSTEALLEQTVDEYRDREAALERQISILRSGVQTADGIEAEATRALRSADRFRRLLGKLEEKLRHRDRDSGEPGEYPRLDNLTRDRAGDRYGDVPSY